MREAAFALIFIAGAALFLLTQDPEQREEVRPTHDFTRMCFEVNWTNSSEETTEVYHSRGGDPNFEVVGYSECQFRHEIGTSFCDIWTERPRYVDGDPRMDTLGHEILHGLAGGFHE